MLQGYNNKFITLIFCFFVTFSIIKGNNNLESKEMDSSIQEENTDENKQESILKSTLKAVTKETILTTISVALPTILMYGLSNIVNIKNKRDDDEIKILTSSTLITLNLPILMFYFLLKYGYKGCKKSSKISNKANLLLMLISLTTNGAFLYYPEIGYQYYNNGTNFMIKKLAKIFYDIDTNGCLPPPKLEKSEIAMLTLPSVLTYLLTEAVYDKVTS